MSANRTCIKAKSMPIRASQELNQLSPAEHRKFNQSNSGQVALPGLMPMISGEKGY